MNTLVNPIKRIPSCLYQAVHTSMIWIGFLLLAMSHAYAEDAWPITAMESASSDNGSFNKPNDLLNENENDLTKLNWQTAALQDVHPREVVPSEKGFADKKITRWYRLSLDALANNASMANTQHERYFYLPRWQTIGKIAVYVDNRLVYRSEGGAVWNGYNHPLWIKLADEGQPMPNNIVLRLDSLVSAGSAITSAWVGTEDALKWRYIAREWIQAKLPEIASASLLLMGLFALALWARRRQETLYLLFFFASTLSYIRCLQYYVGLEPLPIPEQWFTWLNLNASGWLVISIYFFCYRLHGKQYGKVEIMSIVMMSLVTLCTMPSLPFLSNLGPMLSLANLVIFSELILLTVVMGFASWRSLSYDGMLLSFMHALNIPLGIHDLMLQNYAISMDHIYLLPYTTLGPLFVLVLIINRRFLSALLEVENANKNLEIRLKQREAELEASHEQLRRIEQEQLLSQERQRLVRDMHDGLGSSLISALAVVERGQLTPEQIALVLKECIDDLKLTIDSLEPLDCDVLLILATLRYRLEPRLTQSGITLDWAVTSLPKLVWLTPTHALYLLRILQELFTNVIKHANAQQITVKTHHDDQHVVIQVLDNGIGFDLTRIHHGRGLNNLTLRSQHLGGTIQWESNNHGTTVTLKLPIAFNSP